MSRPQVAVLDDYQRVAAGAADWSPVTSQADVTTYDHQLTGARLVQALQDKQIVVIMRERTPFPAELFEQLPTLRLLVTTGMRNASVDLAAAAAHGVTVCGTASKTTPPAELTWALILGLQRHLVAETAAMRSNGPWQSTVGRDLAGATLGLLGLGKIGVQVARVGRAFGMDVVAWSANLTAERTDAEDVRLAASLPELLAASDVFSVHLVLSGRTRGLVDAAALKQLRRSAVLVNTSRAAIVDQDALVDALRAGTIAGAGLDVFDEEPLPEDHPFRTLPTVLATPHIGYVSVDNYATYFTEAVADIVAFLAGRPIRVVGGHVTG